MALIKKDQFIKDYTIWLRKRMYAILPDEDFEFEMLHFTKMIVNNEANHIRQASEDAEGGRNDE